MKVCRWLPLLLVGCSSVNEISTSNHKIHEHAVDILNSSSIISAHNHARAIVKETGDIAGVLGNIKDVTPWWAEMINYGFIALVIVGVCFILWYTGLGSLIKKLCFSLGMFIPDRKLQQAKLLQEAQDDKNPTTLREAIAAFRAADPAFDAAYKKIKTETTPSS